jgi:hypothetical protein
MGVSENNDETQSTATRKSRNSSQIIYYVANRELTQISDVEGGMIQFAIIYVTISAFDAICVMLVYQKYCGQTIDPWQRDC